MFEYIKTRIKARFMSQKQEAKIKEVHLISSSLQDSLIYFRKEFEGSSDLTIREMKVSGASVAVITMDGLTNSSVLVPGILNPLMAMNLNFEDPKKKYEHIRDSVLTGSDQIETVNYEQAFRFLMSGFALIAVDGYPSILAIGVQGFNFRSISEPFAETGQRGSREGFVEPLRVNMSMIRRRLKTTKLKFEIITIGSKSQTDICLCYLTDVVSQDILREIRKRINLIDLDMIMDSGYLAPYLEQDRDWSFFNSVGMSERPDTVCGKISEGRVVVLVDGTPNALIVPYLFVEYFQNMDDYSVRPYFATFTRWIKYFAFIVSILLPGIYVAMGTFNPELFPGELINKVAMSVSKTPFSLLIEILLIHFIYEVMREAGLRLPRPLGFGVSIVGGLIVGETAVNAGLIGSPTLIVVAATAMFSYVIPNLYESAAILRFIFIIIGGTMGMWGVMLGFAVVLVNICSKTNYGIPFSAPVSPFSLFGMRDVAIRAGWKFLAKKNAKIQKTPGAAVDQEMEKK